MYFISQYLKINVLSIIIALGVLAPFISVATNANLTVTIQSNCGDGVIQTGEECDGSNFAGQTCASRGFSGGSLSCNSNCAINTSQCSSAPPPSGGGGGGGGFFTVAPETKVVFSGRAYPGSKVTLLKDAQIAATVLADSNAAFNISLSDLSSGSYIFGIYSEDNSGRRSSLVTYPVSVTTGVAIQVGGIFIAPTIAVDKSEVKRGDNIAIFGQSVPNSEVIISVNSDEEFFNKIKADAGGAYLYNFDTSPLENGQHFTKSKVALGGEISSFSKAIGFAVGTKNITATLQKTALKEDLNNDNRVNLIDFSIVAYWYKRPNPPVTADFNKDGKIDLTDFSIMAFYWTG